MAYTEANLSAIRSAIAKGELEVWFGDRRVKYRSMDELIQAESRIAAALATPRAKQHLAYASKGFVR